MNVALLEKAAKKLTSVQELSVLLCLCASSSFRDRKHHLRTWRIFPRYRRLHFLCCTKQDPVYSNENSDPKVSWLYSSENPIISYRSRTDEGVMLHTQAECDPTPHYFLARQASAYCEYPGFGVSFSCPSCLWVLVRGLELRGWVGPVHGHWD